MTLYAQHGYGKSDKLGVLADAGAIAGVILSPADEPADALRVTAQGMAARKIETLLDPQTYVYCIPDASARCHFESGLDFGPIFWGSITSAEVAAHVDAVLAANISVGTTGPIIAPTPLQGGFTDLWLPLAMQYANTTAAKAGGRAVLASVVVEEDGLGDWAAIERWLDVVTTLDVAGFYLIVGRRAGYPAAWDQARLASLLRIVYRLRVINDYRVVVGYSDISGLTATAMGADGVASGWSYRQRHFNSQRWVPKKGGQQASPRVTSGPLLSTLLAQGEMDSVARSSLAAQVLPDAALVSRLAARADSWTNPDAQLQHLGVLGRLVLEVEAAGDVSARLDYLSASITEARRLMAALARAGVALSASHTTALANMGTGLLDARRAEGV